MADYTDPVKQLLEIGEVKERTLNTPEKWIDYVQDYQLSEANVPELVQMAQDSDLNNAKVESKEVWAPLHAWRTLGQLQAKSAIEPLLPLLNFDDDYSMAELPIVYSMFGIAAVEPLTQFLADRNNTLQGRSVAADCLAKIGNKDEAARHLCVSAIANQLSHYVRQNPILNGFLVLYLMELEAVEAADVMEKAFAAGCVDDSLMGDWQEVQTELGLIPFSELQNRRYEEAHRPLVDFSAAASKSDAKTKQPKSGFGGGGKKKKKKKK